MNRLQIADSIILDLGYNDAEEKPDRRQIFADMDKHLPIILTQTAKQMGDGILNNFNVTTICPIKYDTGMMAYFVDTSGIVPMNLQGFAGIRQIGDTGSIENDYVPVQRGWGSIMSYLEVNGMAGRVGFWLQGNIPYIKNPPIVVPNVARVTYVPTILNLSDTDEITIPAETLSFISDKMVEVLMLQKQTSENIANDSKDNQ